MNEMKPDIQYLPCDYCHKDMTQQEYLEHACDGLSGKNPMQEKLRNAKWRTPSGMLTAIGSIANMRKPTLWERIKDWFWHE